MKKVPVTDRVFAEGDAITVIDSNHLYANKAGVIERLGSAGEDVTYVHAKLEGINTIIAFRTFQVQKGN